MRQRNILPEPKSCDVCGASVCYFEGEAKFDKGRIVGMWKCLNTKCRALVSCHRNTKNPLGYMATESVRLLRTECHRAFDKLWSVEESRWTRQTAYSWMADLLGIERHVANISKLNEEQLREVIRASKEMYHEHLKVLSEIKRQHRSSSKDRRMRDSVIRNQNRKPNVKINARNYENYVE